MPKGDVAVWEERAERALLVGQRYVDMGVRFRVYVRGKGDKPVPDRWIGPVYGGLYDRKLRRYIGPPAVVHEVSVTEPTLDFIFDDNPNVIRVLLIGAPGAGKSQALVRRMLRMNLQFPNRTWGGVGATDERRRIIWDEYESMVRPMGFIEDLLEKRKEIRLWNGTINQILAGTAPSRQAGTPLQGRSWSGAFPDEHQSMPLKVHQEIDARGRRAGDSYRVCSTATNQADIPEFAEELDRFDQNPKTHKVIRVAGTKNPFVKLSYYKKLRSRYSERDAKAILDGEAIPPENRVYHAYDSKRNLCARPADKFDITADVLAKKFRRKGQYFKYLGAVDFGRVITCTEILRCYEIDGRRAWWVVDEIKTTRELYKVHAREVLSKYYASDIALIGDPHHNIPRKDIDKTPYRIFRSEGLVIKPAVPKGYIPIEHRLAMMNALLGDADGVTSLHIDILPNGKPAAPELHRAFLTEERTADGRSEGRKDIRYDWSHYPAAVGYGVYHWEKVRATVAKQVRTITSSAA